MEISIASQSSMPESRRVTAFSYPIHLSQVRCTGGEKSLLNCTHGAGTGCDHRRDAAIVCRKRETCKKRILKSYFFCLYSLVL